MKKHSDNIFAKKFRLLSSQESQEINWSSSESSDSENVSSKVDKLCNFKKKVCRKRKRKKSAPKNISNLDITVIDVPKENKIAIKTNDTINGIKKEDDNNSGMKSPILGSTQYFSPYNRRNEPTSPIFSCKTLEYQSKTDVPLKSPILVLKRPSPKVSPNVRKKLFKLDAKTNIKSTISSYNSLITHENDCLDRRKCPKKENYKQIKKYSSNLQRKENQNNPCIDLKISYGNINNETSVLSKSKLLSSENILGENVQDKLASLQIPNNLKVEIEDTSQENKTKEVCVIAETPELNMDDSIAMLKTSNINLAKKIKNYFDNQFSSENPSQQTISEVSTPKNSSKTSDDVEIISSITQVASNKNSMESIKQDDTVPDVDKKEKKIRYKKDGLAYRLNNLLKKQTASISLWQHEKFLAANSNFVIPKGEFLALRVTKVSFKYGCHLLDAMDLEDNNFMILINCSHSDDNIFEDCIIKLYEPYTMLDFKNDCKLIINVTKFECVTIKK